jgi:hypothetical protein
MATKKEKVYFRSLEHSVRCVEEKYEMVEQKLGQ